MKKCKSIYVPMNGETGSTKGPKCHDQSLKIKFAIVKAFPAATITFNSGHYYCSCFVKFNENNIVYLMTSDYRFFDQSFLVRQVKNEKDYTGGRNNSYQGFDNIITAIQTQKLFNEGAKFVAQ
jgi:hypothetical protein